jgi:hypothetical protein
MVDFRDIDLVLEAIRTSYAWRDTADLPYTARRAEVLNHLCTMGTPFEEGTIYYGPASIFRPTKLGVGDTVQLSGDYAWCVRLVK